MHKTKSYEPMKALKYISSIIVAVAAAFTGAAAVPTVVCSSDQLVVSPETNIVEAVASATVQDLDGGALLVEWHINGVLALAANLDDANIASGVTISFTNNFAYGTNMVELRVSDDLFTNFVEWVSCSSLIVVASNSAPVVLCSESQTLDCADSGLMAISAVSISEPDGDPLKVEWFVNGQLFSTVDLPADAATNPITLYLTNTYPVGTNLVSVAVTDEQSNVVECASEIVMLDTTAPVIKSIRASKEVIWPPNHKLVNVCLSVEADDCTPVTWKITRITSNERCVNGAGNTSPDYFICKNKQQALLRAERSGNGYGRIYTLFVEVKDTSGNTSTGCVKVYVPHDRGNSKCVKPQPKAKPPVVTVKKATTYQVKAQANGQEKNNNSKSNSNSKSKSNGKKK